MQNSFTLSAKLAGALLSRSMWKP